MNFGLAAGAEAVPTSARFGVEAHEPQHADTRRSRCDRKQRAAAADEIEQAV
jgi:hypothetical protein